MTTEQLWCIMGITLSISYELVTCRISFNRFLNRSPWVSSFRNDKKAKMSFRIPKLRDEKSKNQW